MCPPLYLKNNTNIWKYSTEVVQLVAPWPTTHTKPIFFFLIHLSRAGWNINLGRVKSPQKVRLLIHYPPPFLTVSLNDWKHRVAVCYGAQLFHLTCLLAYSQRLVLWGRVLGEYYCINCSKYWETGQIQFINALLKCPCLGSAVLKRTTRCHQKAFRNTLLFSWRNTIQSIWRHTLWMD